MWSKLDLKCTAGKTIRSRSSARTADTIKRIGERNPWKLWNIAAVNAVARSVRNTRTELGAGHGKDHASGNETHEVCGPCTGTSANTSTTIYRLGRTRPHKHETSYEPERPGIAYCESCYNIAKLYNIPHD